MKKNVTTFIVVAFALSLGTLFLLSLVSVPTLLAPPESIIPTDCSAEAITQIWNQIFKQDAIPTQNAIWSFVNSPAGCTKYLVTHTTAASPSGSPTRILTAYEQDGQVFTIALYARICTVGGNNCGADWFGNLLTNYNAGNNDKIVQQFYSTGNPEYIHAWSPDNVATPPEASTEFTNIFDINAGPWGSNALVYFNSPLTDNSPQWRFIENSPLGELTLTGYVFQDMEIVSATFVQDISTSPPPNPVCGDGTCDTGETTASCPADCPAPPTCTPNWVAHNTPCNSSEVYITWYNDTNTCGLEPLANITVDCDFDNNGIIGNVNDIDEHNVDDIEIEIEGDLLDLGDTYSGTRDLEILEDGNKRVIFEWDFDDEPLNLRKIELRKQSSNGDYGYFIVNGISAEKEIRVNVVADTNSVCIKDREDISSISSISDDCDRSGEEVINCPGDSDDGDVKCEIKGNYLAITGLRNSAVTEYDDNYTPPTCTESWTYTAWSSCISGQQSRTATDANDCGTTSNRLSLTQSCSTGGGTSCTPNWDCPDWSTITCPESGTKTRSCTDLNSCNTLSSRPDTTRTCVQAKEPNTALIIGLIIGILLLIGVIVLVFSIMKRKSREKRFAQPRTNKSPRIVTGGPSQPKRY
jgi:hypothetical protein